MTKKTHGTDRDEQASSLKPTLSRVNLRKHGVVFDDAIYPIHLDNENGRILPPHVESLQRALLNFGVPINSDQRAEFAEKHEEFKVALNRVDDHDGRSWSHRAQEVERHFTLSPPDDAKWSGRLRTGGISSLDVLTENAKVAEDAAGRMERRQAESEWTLYLRNNVFKEYRYAIPDRTQYMNLFDQWSLVQDTAWLDHKTNQDDSAQPLSSPKPDLSYGFPIFQNDKDLPIGLADFDCARNFSVDNLIKLRNPDRDDAGVKCSLNRGLLKVSQGKCKIEQLSEYELMCFPWAVVEVKKPNVKEQDVEFCYCQAVNGSAVALRIFESIFLEAYGAIPHDLPPIIAFTCIGPDLKVWLVFIDHTWKPRQRVMMRCIFATTLELGWGVLAARERVKNMHVWASRVLKPRISAALSQIRTKQATRMVNPDERFTIGRSADKERAPGLADDSDFKQPSLLRRVATTLGSPVKPFTVPMNFKFNFPFSTKKDEGTTFDKIRFPNTAHGFVPEQSSPSRGNWLRKNISKLKSKKRRAESPAAETGSESESVLATEAQGITRLKREPALKSRDSGLPNSSQPLVAKPGQYKIESEHAATSSKVQPGLVRADRAELHRNDDQIKGITKSSSKTTVSAPLHTGQQNGHSGVAPHSTGSAHKDTSELDGSSNVGPSPNTESNTTTDPVDETNESVLDEQPNGDGNDDGNHDNDEDDQSVEHEPHGSELDRESEEAATTTSVIHDLELGGDDSDESSFVYTSDDLSTCETNDPDGCSDRESAHSKADSGDENDDDSNDDDSNDDDSNDDDSNDDDSNDDDSHDEQHTPGPQDIRVWGQCAFRCLQAEHVTAFPAFEAFVEDATCQNLLLYIVVTMFENESSTAQDWMNSFGLREAFWAGDRVLVNKKYLKVIAASLLLTLKTFGQPRPTRRRENSIIDALNELGREGQYDILREIYKAAVSCLSIDELSLQLNSKAIYAILGGTSGLEHDALDKLYSLTSEELPEYEREDGWMTRYGKWVPF